MVRFHPRPPIFIMIAAPHMIVGAILGSLIQNFPLAFLAGLASHFIFDAIPHLEFSIFWPPERQGKLQLTKGEYIFIFFDVLIGILLVLWIFCSRVENWSILAGAFGAILPDLIDNVPFWSPRLRKVAGFRQFHQFHNFCHSKLSVKYWIFGLPIYIIVIGIAIWFFLARG